MKRIALALLLIISQLGNAQNIGGKYYVAHPDSTYSGMNKASDSNDGSYTNPWATWQKAFETAAAGDTVYFRGGVWEPSSFLTNVPNKYSGAINFISPKNGFGNNGQPGKYICYLNYPGEKPILDCNKVMHPDPNPYGDGNMYISGLEMTDAHFMHFRGLTIRNVYQRDNYVRVRGILAWPLSNMIFENITINNIGGEGWYMTSEVGVTGEGLGWDGSGVIPYDTTRWVNCDTYQCCDSLPGNTGNTPGNMSDGFKMIAYPGAYHVFDGCRAWHCGDDGFDLPGGSERIVKNCWSFNHRYEGEDFEGNGFKMGATGDDLNGLESIKFHNNLVAWSSIGLFLVEYEGYRRTNSRVYNNSFYKCGIGFSGSDNSVYPTTNSIFRNNLVYDPISSDAGGRPYILDMNFYYEGNHNSWSYAESGSLPNWDYNTDLTLTDDDFVLTSETTALIQLMASRKSDGSLPDITFMHLADGSDLIDYGSQIPESDNSGVILDYSGTAPDLGAFEYITGAPTARFTASATTVFTGEIIAFNASESSDDGSIASYTWDFGDNTAASEVTSSHSYSQEGSYKVQLTVTDNSGNKATATKSITVNKIRTLEIISYTPNPTTDYVNIVFYSPNDQSITISVLNSSNTVVLTDTQNATEGESNQLQLDLSELAVGNYTITLTDGSSTVSCQVTKEESRPLEIISYSPNPTTGTVSISYYAPETGLVTISVKNNSGTQVLSLNHNATGNTNNQVNVDLSSFIAGVYTITLSDGNTSASCQVTREYERPLEITGYSPNPTTGNVTVVYYSPVETVITIKVFNSVGAQVSSFTRSAFMGENNTVDIDLTGMAAGIYTIQLSDGNSNDTCYVTLQDNVPPRSLEIISATSSTYDIFTVIYYSPSSGTVSIEVFNTSGQLVLNKNQSSTAGNNTTDLDLSGLTPGEYRVTLYDGSSSDECSVTKLEQEIQYEFKYLSSSPNPTVDLFAIEFTYTESSVLTLSIMDETGRMVLIDQYQAKKGSNKAVINLSELEAGNYVVKISNSDSEIKTNVTKQSFLQ